MSDERLSDAIRDALLADDPGAVPKRLRTRMAMIPEETAPTRAASSWRDRLSTFALPTAVVAAVAVVAIVFGGIALRGPQTASVAPSAVPGTASPAVSPSTSAPASAEPTPASATPEVAPSGPTTIVNFDVTWLPSGAFAVRDGVAYIDTDTTAAPSLQRDDLATDKITTLVQVPSGHAIASAALTDAGIVWVETWYTMPPVSCAGTGCSPRQGQPVSWALHLTTLDGATTTQLDAGVVSVMSVGGEGAGPLPPAMAAQGGRVAYAVPRSGVSGAPLASRIVVRSLPDGAVVRSIDTAGYVVQLGVDGQAVMLREAPKSIGPGNVVADDTTLKLAASDGAAPTSIATHVADATIGDGGVAGADRIAWVSNDPNDFRVRVADLTDLKPVPVDGPPHQPALQGGSAVAPRLVGNGLAWIAQLQLASGLSTSEVDVWSPGWAYAQRVASLGTPDLLDASGNLLLVASQQSTVIPPGVIGAVPASALFGTTP